MSAMPLTREGSARLERLYRLYAGRVLALAMRRTGDRHAAEDVAGETWLRAASSLQDLNADDAAAFGWLATITRRAAVDYFRPARARERPTDFGDPVAERCLSAAPPAELVVLADPVPAGLPPVWRDALERLTAAQRESLLWRCQGLSWRAVGWHVGRHHSSAREAARRGARVLTGAVVA